MNFTLRGNCMQRKLKQWWSTIAPISTKQTINSDGQQFHQYQQNEQQTVRVNNLCFVVDIGGIVDHHCLLFALLILVELLTITVYCSFCWYCWNCWPSLFIVRFVDIGGIIPPISTTKHNKQWWSTIPAISTKRTINSNGQQFHQYQQIEQ
jgi:hypothetical protein